MTLNRFDLDHIVNDTEHALRDAADYLYNNSLPSIWSARGRGWQELFVESQRQGRPAGFYASCDGLLILGYSSAWSHNRFNEFAWRVYRHTLCPVFESSPARTVAQRLMRDQVLPNTMKLARFLHASTLWRDRPVAINIATRVAATLCERGKRGQWSAATSTTDTSLAATVEATMALIAWHSEMTPAARHGIAYLTGIAKVSPHSTTDWQRFIVATWALSRVLTHLDGKLVRRLVQQVLAYRDLSHSDSTPYREDFFLPSKAHDYYHYDVGILCAQCLLHFRQASLITANDLRMIFPRIAAITACVRKYGLYSPDRPGRYFRFWQHHQALQLLSTFRDSARVRGLLEKGVFMVIKPKVFPVRPFRVDTNLAVVLMPFREPWSDDLYGELRNTLRATGIKAWRSDEEFKDDKIVESIWEYINRAAFVIADCTNKNPNVFYELGLAHTLGKPVFICTQNSRHIPFDIESIRHFRYSMQPTGIKKLKKDLTSFVRDLRNEDSARKS